MTARLKSKTIEIDIYHVNLIIKRLKWFQDKIITRDKNRHFINDERTIRQEDLTTLNVCVLSIRASKYIKHKLTELKEEIGKPIVLVRHCSISLLVN